MGLGRGRGFQIGFQVMGFWWPWAVGRGFDCGGIWFEI